MDSMHTSLQLISDSCKAQCRRLPIKRGKTFALVSCNAKAVRESNVDTAFNDL